MESECSEAGGRDAFDRMMKLEPRPTAVLALSDIIAWGIIEAARENKMHVPNDLAVVGFDDLLASRLISPALTTVRQPTIEKGKRAAQLFIQILRCETPTTEAEKVLLPVQLIVRASSVPPVKP
jgi:DNA-binding LacI/PurR family transcriptional regulator